MKMGTPIILLSACSSSLQRPTAIISGALSHHYDNGKHDEINPLLGLEFNKTQCGIYDNSRLNSSESVYCSNRWLNLSIPKIPITLTSKLGASLYDNQGNYKWSLKPIFAIGARIKLNQRIFIDLDYMPTQIIGGNDVATISAGVAF